MSNSLVPNDYSDPDPTGGIKFNLMRAIEEFQDLNYDDMDVMAPPSGPDFRKEREVAQLLDDYLGQLIENGVFDDCDLRGEYSLDIENEKTDNNMIEKIAPRSHSLLLLTTKPISPHVAKKSPAGASWTRRMLNMATSTASAPRTRPRAPDSTPKRPARAPKARRSR